MSEQQYNQIQNLKLSEPVPMELIPLILRLTRQRNCPEWFRNGLSRYMENSIKTYN